MYIDTSNNTLVLEPTECSVCCGFYGGRRDVPKGTNPIFAIIPCPACKGTGKRGPGRCRKCCSGYKPTPGKQTDYSTVTQTVPCSKCHGNYKDADMESTTDKIPSGLIDHIPIKVFRLNRAQSFNEAYLGFGYFYSVTDYGEHTHLTDEQLIEKVRNDHSYKTTQATNIVRSKDDLRIIDYVAIITNNNGYTIKGMFNEDV